jgi:NADH-quinone oxidoreductase subunit K
MIAMVIAVSGLLFCIGAAGVLLNRAHAVRMLLAFELMILASFMVIAAGAAPRVDPNGYALAFFVLTVAAAESAIGLALLIVYYRLRGSVRIDSMRTLRG